MCRSIICFRYLQVSVNKQWVILHSILKRFLFVYWLIAKPELCLINKVTCLSFACAQFVRIMGGLSAVRKTSLSHTWVKFKAWRDLECQQKVEFVKVVALSGSQMHVSTYLLGGLLVFVVVFSTRRVNPRNMTTSDSEEGETVETHTSARLVQSLILPQDVWTSVSTVPWSPLCTGVRGKDERSRYEGFTRREEGNWWLFKHQSDRPPIC